MLSLHFQLIYDTKLYQKQTIKNEKSVNVRFFTTKIVNNVVRKEERSKTKDQRHKKSQEPRTKTKDQRQKKSQEPRTKTKDQRQKKSQEQRTKIKYTIY